MTSSLWSEDDKTLRVWVYLMARAGSNGAVLDTIPAIARACGYSLADVEAVLEKLAGPDKYSRSPEMSGRRIAIVREPEFAIHLINHSKYREKDHTHAERQRRYRERKAAESDAGSDGSDAARRPVTQAEAEAEARSNGSSVSPPVPSVTAVEPRESPEMPELSVYGAAVMDVWHELRGSPFPQGSQRDFQQLSDWHGSGIPLRVVERGITDCIETMRKRGDKPVGKTLAYYNSAVRQAYGQWRKAIA